MRALRQTFVLTRATKVAVDRSVVQRTTNFTKGKGKVFPLQARLWPRGWVEV